MLPTPRTLLTSIITSLANTPIPTPLPTHHGTTKATTLFNDSSDNNTPSNPLKGLSPAHRALLTSLHVFLPPSTLLQALDLLDRGLVTCVTQTRDIPAALPQSNSQATGDLPTVGPAQQVSAAPHVSSTSSSPSHNKIKISTPETQQPNSHTLDHVHQKPKPNTLYLVRSSQTPRGRSAASRAAQLTYVVRPTSWNCSCAAFTFAAFPGSWAGSSTSAALSFGIEDDEDEDGAGAGAGNGEGERRRGCMSMEKGTEEWEFGGRSADGKEGGNVPCCKHLLACVLAERWDVLWPFVVVREVVREEMAGLGVEG